MGKELVLGEPILKCYQKGRMMTMMLSKNERSLPWIYYNNMQICCHNYNERGEGFVMDICNSVAPFITKDWDACPYIRDNSYSIERIRKKYILLEYYIKECIDNNEYVYFCLNTSFVSAYCKKKYSNNMMHDIFVCGYDDQGNFICYDYFNDDYSKKSVSAYEIEQAVLHLNDCTNVGDYVNGIHSFLLQEPYQFTFFTANDINCNQILQKMFEIINPEYSEPRNMMIKRDNGKDIHFFGLEVYDKYVEYLRTNKGEIFDYRPVYVIKDHIQIIKDTIMFFDMPFKGEVQELCEIVKEATMVALKEYLCHKDGHNNALAKKIICIKNEEKKLITAILDYYEYIM